MAAVVGMLTDCYHPRTSCETVPPPDPPPLVVGAGAGADGVGGVGVGGVPLPTPSSPARELSSRGRGPHWMPVVFTVLLKLLLGHGRCRWT